MRRMFNSKRRETVWLRARYAAHAAGRGRYPICPHCDLPVYETDDWDECHLPGRERAFGAGSGVEDVTVGHRRCNQLHARTEVVPAVAKSNRVRRKFIGAHKPGMGPRPMRGGRRDDFKVAVGGGVKPRLTNAQKHAAFVSGRCLTAADGSPVGIFAPEAETAS